MLPDVACARSDVALCSNRLGASPARCSGAKGQDRSRLEFLLYGATSRERAVCCGATLMSPLRRDGAPAASAADRDEAPSPPRVSAKSAQCFRLPSL